MVIHTFNPRTGEAEAEAGEAVSLQLAWYSIPRESQASLGYIARDLVLNKLKK